MSILPVDGPPANHRVLETPTPVLNVPSHADAVCSPVPTDEKVRAIDSAFMHQHQEQQTVASLIGLRMSALLMHDLAKDAVPATRRRRRGRGKDQPAET